MSMVDEWFVFLGYGVMIFLVGLIWIRKEKRDRAKSPSQLRKNESSGHLGTGLVDTNRQL